MSNYFDLLFIVNVALYCAVVALFNIDNTCIVTLKCRLRSLRVVRNGTIGKLRYGFLFTFHSNYGRIFSRFDTMHERDSQTDRQTDRQTPSQPPHDGTDRASA